MTRIFALAVALYPCIVAAQGARPSRADTTAFDLVIAGGRIFDGSGNPWFYADVGIRNGRVAAVGRLDSARAVRRVDAK